MILLVLGYVGLLLVYSVGLELWRDRDLFCQHPLKRFVEVFTP